eukprot:c21312_g1_i2.p1 GENE.c21312_g1_i2~~c21312_g1_i2.p1  ORF type:complete len:487 (+),score=205.20 c21312_g1_i2:108-1568(+)
MLNDAASQSLWVLGFFALVLVFTAFINDQKEKVNGSLLIASYFSNSNTVHPATNNNCAEALSSLPENVLELSTSITPSTTPSLSPSLSLPPSPSPPSTGASHIVGTSFLKFLQTFPWDDFKNAYLQHRNDATTQFTSDLVHGLSEFIAMEPLVPVDKNCRPEPLTPPEQIQCSNYMTGTTGQRRSKPARVGHLIQLGFDIDVLETLLYELDDVVDYFFILESTRSHSDKLRKPLMWEKVRVQERFKPFKNKVIHMLLDDIDIGTQNYDPGNIFFIERFQETERWRKFQEWNEKFKYFGDDDILGFGDTDEVPSRQTVNILKHCNMHGSVDIGIWFPFSLLDQAFRPDFPVPGHPYTLGDPTYWPLRAAKTRIPNRERGTSGRYLLGGMHMTNHRYLPYLIVKRLTGTEYGFAKHSVLLDMLRQAGQSGNVKNLESVIGDQANAESRLVPLSQIANEMRNIAIIPWYLKCNLNRYPYWQKGHDTRLD